MYLECHNIHCTICGNNNDVWLCVDYWQQHKTECHNKRAIVNSRLVTTI